MEKATERGFVAKRTWRGGRPAKPQFSWRDSKPVRRRIKVESKLERINGSQTQDLRELVQGSSTLVEELHIAQVVKAQAIAIMFLGPIDEFLVKLVVQEDFLVRARDLFFGQDNAKPEARGPPAVLHALLD